VCVTDKNTFVLQSCTDALRVEHGLCSETSIWNSVDSNEGISKSIEREEVHIKEEHVAIARSFSSIEDRSEVSPQTFHRYLGLPSVFMLFCLSAFPHKSSPCDEWKWSVYIYRVC
jgi:predicted ATP-dependent serine protease